MCDVLSCGQSARRGKYSDAFCDACWDRLVQEIDKAGEFNDSVAPYGIDWGTNPNRPHWDADGWDRYYELVGG